MDAVKRERSYREFARLLGNSNKTAATVAKDLGFSPTLFSDWKSNKSAPGADKLIKISEYFGVPITTFFI